MAVPTNITGLALVQCRMIAGIAHLRGYDLTDPRVRNAVLVCLLGEEAVGSLVGERRLPAPPMALATTFVGGLRFYFTEWLGVRVEVRDYVLPLSVFQSGENAVEDADQPSFDVTNLVLAQLGVSFVF